MKALPINTEATILCSMKMKYPSSKLLCALTLFYTLSFTFFHFLSSATFAWAGPQRQQKTQQRRQSNPFEVAETKQTDTQLNDVNRPYFFLGPAIANGNWIADPQHTTLSYFGLGYWINSGPLFVDLNLGFLSSLTSPRTFSSSGNIALGIIAQSQNVKPFIGLETGISRTIISGKGQIFGFKLSPEVGFFPFSIKDHPISLKAQYTWIPERINGKQPAWYSLLFGFHI